MATCLIGIGANMGDPAAQITSSVELLKQHADIRVDAVSQFRVTPPAGGPADQNNFVNAVVRATTSVSPQQMLNRLQRIEHQLGRQHDVRWGPRPIDLDLLLFDELVLNDEDLELPHPRMAYRRFVIEPACEIAADMVHPRIGWSLGQIALHLDASRDYIAVTGVAGSGKTALLRAVGQRTAIIGLTDAAAEAADDVAPAADLALRETQIMQQRIQILQRIPEPRRPSNRHPGTYCISDFWFDQSAAYIACGFSGQVQTDLQNRVEEFRKEIPCPKLLVVLTRAGPDTPANANEKPATSLACIERQLLDLSRIPRRGPTLWLDAKAPRRAADEIVAAIEAM